MFDRVLSSIYNGLSVSCAGALPTGTGNGSTAFTVVRIISGLVGGILRTPTSSLLNVVENLTVGLASSGFNTAIGTTITPVAGRVGNTTGVISGLSPALNRAISNCTALIGSFIGAGVLGRSGCFIGAVGTVLATMNGSTVSLSLGSLLTLINGASGTRLLLLICAMNMDIVAGDSLLDSLLGNGCPNVISVISGLSPDGLLAVVERIVTSARGPGRVT